MSLDRVAPKRQVNRIRGETKGYATPKANGVCWGGSSVPALWRDPEDESRPQRGSVTPWIILLLSLFQCFLFKWISEENQLGLFCFPKSLNFLFRNRVAHYVVPSALVESHVWYIAFKETNTLKEDFDIFKYAFFFFILSEKVALEYVVFLFF